MESPNIILTSQQDKDIPSIISMSNEKKVDQQMLTQIEYLIQQQFQVFVPALIFEYRPNIGVSKEFTGWDYDDLYEFFSHFGEIDLLEIYGKISIILFKTFIDAYTSREFLMNSSNFKESEKNNFIVRWYTQDDESYISDGLKSKFKKYTASQIVEQISSNNTNKNQNNNYMSYMNYNNNNNDYQSNLANNFNGQYSYYSSWTLNPNARNEFNNVISSQTQNSGYRGYGNDEDNKSYSSDKSLSNGKYTCKFEIQIENENEFQVARRLIGAKVFLSIKFLGL